ncbi:MAG TPA: hypothetical protein PL188_08670 [Candidatus Cloacimonadota bacterium]|nr:hypothetical protein [Candidatus Cloacimonadota bacterium]
MRIVDKIIIMISILAILGCGYWLVWMLNNPLGKAESDTTLIDTMQEPLQSEAKGIALPITNKKGLMYIFTAKAEYSIAGVLVSKQRYYSGPMSQISPYDYALVWGEVPNHLKYLTFSQVLRFCLMDYDANLPITLNYLYTHVSNNHLIPATKNIRGALKLAKEGDKVVLDGYLVNVDLGKKGRTVGNWTTSLDRKDQGAGACEIIYLTRLRINNQVFE